MSFHAVFPRSLSHVQCRRRILRLHSALFLPLSGALHSASRRSSLAPSMSAYLKRCSLLTEGLPRSAADAVRIVWSGSSLPSKGRLLGLWHELAQKLGVNHVGHQFPRLVHDTCRTAIAAGTWWRETLQRHVPLPIAGLKTLSSYPRFAIVWYNTIEQTLPRARSYAMSIFEKASQGRCWLTVRKALSKYKAMAVVGLKPLQTLHIQPFQVICFSWDCAGDLLNTTTQSLQYSGALSNPSIGAVFLSSLCYIGNVELNLFAILSALEVEGQLFLGAD